MRPPPPNKGKELPSNSRSFGTLVCMADLSRAWFSYAFFPNSNDDALQPADINVSNSSGTLAELVLTVHAHFKIKFLSSNIFTLHVWIVFAYLYLDSHFFSHFTTSYFFRIHSTPLAFIIICFKIYPAYKCSLCCLGGIRYILPSFVEWNRGTKS